MENYVIFTNSYNEPCEKWTITRECAQAVLRPESFCETEFSITLSTPQIEWRSQQRMKCCRRLWFWQIQLNFVVQSSASVYFDFSAENIGFLLSKNFLYFSTIHLSKLDATGYNLWNLYTLFRWLNASKVLTTSSFCTNTNVSSIKMSIRGL